MKYSSIAFLSLGSNLGDRFHYLEQAIWEISLLPAVKILSQSKPLETLPLENTNQPSFLNQIVKIRVIQSIEQKLGRQHRSWKGPREIDIDILAYESVVMNTDFLTLPHHSLFTRPFIKQILNEMGESDLYTVFQDVYNEKYHSRV